MTHPMKLPNHLDTKALSCRAVIETPKGRRCKYDLDRKTGLYRLKSLLPEGMSFPLDMGFVPSTLADDGDPVDIMVLADEPLAVGAFLDVRLIGVIEARETEDGKKERNDRVIGVAGLSLLYERVRDLDDLNKSFVDDLGKFWSQKAALDGKRFEVLAARGPHEAARMVKEGARRAKKG